MLEKHVEHDKYALTELSNGEGKDNVFATPENAFNDIPEKNDDEDKNRDIDVLHEMKFRNALPQILATCAKNLLLLTYGMTLGITTIAIPALEGNADKGNMSDAQHSLRTDIITLTSNEISWFSKSNIIICFIYNITKN